MTIASELLEGALRSATVIGRGFTASAEDISEALESCNQMLDEWSAAGIVVFSRTRESFTPASSKSSYSIGSGGDFNTTRPVRIEAITVTSDGVDYPLGEWSLEQYNAQPVKATQSIPGHYYYEPTYATGTIYFDYKPSTSSTIVIDSLKPLTRFTSQGVTVSLPEGYESAIRYNLAMRICVDYGRPIPQGLAMLAQNAYNAIYEQSLAQRKRHTSVDAALTTRGGYNILADR